MSRKKNPFRQKRREPSRAAQKREIKKALYKDRVKAMRPYFGEMFKAKSGFDLRKSEEWTGAQRARVTKYWRVMAPHVAKSHKARYFKREDHLREAIAYTQQEAFLPGQRAALFAAEESEALRVKFDSRGAIAVKRQGVEVDKVYFDVKGFMEDPEAEIQKAIEALPDSKRYKIMMGPHESRGSFNKESLPDAIRFLLSKYSDDEVYDPLDLNSQYYQNWLLGLVGYKGRTEQSTEKFLKRERTRRDKEIEARRLEYVGVRREARRKLTRRMRLRMK